MIAIKNFGGRLGNLMFQYAALVGIKHKTGFECVLTKSQNNNPVLTNAFLLKELTEVIGELLLENTYKESSFKFESSFFKIKNNTFIDGYFQNENYFKHCKDIIKKEFTFKNKVIELAQSTLTPLKQTVSVHVRRRDYLALSEIHPPCDLNYYEKAFEYFSGVKDLTFVVCSDDIEWCKKAFNKKKYNIMFVEYNDINELDMCIMSLCNHNIISNSTYSWWSAWLGETSEKIIIAPKKWFGECAHTKHFNMLPVEIVPNRWLCF